MHRKRMMSINCNDRRAVSIIRDTSMTFRSKGPGIYNSLNFFHIDVILTIFRYRFEK